MCSEDYFLQLLEDESIGAFLSLLPEVFFKVQSVWADSVTENGSFFVQVLFMSISELAPAALLPWLLYYYHQGKEKVLFKSRFPFLLSCFTTDSI